MKRIFSILFALVLVISFSLIPAALVGASPGPGIVGLLHLDEGSGATASDSSGLGNDGTLSGGRFGNALSFDGTDDTVTIPHSTSLNLDTAITVEVWIYADTLGTQNGIIRKGLYSQGVTKSWGLDIQNISGVKKARFFIYDGGTPYIAYSAAVSTDTWHHLVGTYDGSTVDIYLDGDNTSSTSVSHTGDIDTNMEDITMGKRDGGLFFDGIIDEVRISNVVRYTTGFTPSTTPFSPDTNTVGLWHLDESVGSIAEDETTNNNDGTINGASWAGPTWTTGKFSNALDFDGTNDYVSVPDSTSLDLSGEITVEAWIKVAVHKNHNAIVIKGEDGAENYELLLTANGLLYSTIKFTDGSRYYPSVPSAITDTEWHHVAMTYKPGEWRIYVDGVQRAERTDISKTPLTNDVPLFIGAEQYLGSFRTERFFNGIIDEVRIWDEARTANQIYQSYAALHVDDDGAEWPGAYPTITQALAVAGTGDTIIVHEGTYAETVVIDKQLTLQGAGSASTIIDASGASADYGILLTAGGTSASQRLTIQGLTVKNSPSHGIKAYKAGGLNLDHVTLDDVVLTLNGVRGMEIHNDVAVSDMEIKSCEFVSNGHQGLRTASNVTVDGLVIADSKFNGNSYGIYLQGTINGVTILRSEFNNSVGGYGGYMTETGPLTNLLIEDSEFNNNVVGLMVWNTKDNSGITIRTTSFQNNDKWGVLIWGNTLTDVLIEDSTVLNNDGLGSGYYGIDFYTYGDAMTNVAVHFTDITGHTAGGGVKNRNAVDTAIVDATANWWGDVSGPYHPGSWIYNSNTITNPSGQGDQVTDYVLYDPWLGPVEIDIKPGSDPNSINPKSKGLIPVAILGSDTFDVEDVDVTTLEFGPDGATPAHDLTDPDVYAEHLQNVNGDAYMDLVSHYRTQDTGIAQGDDEATLTGQTTGGTPITGTDSIRTVGKP